MRSSTSTGPLRAAFLFLVMLLVAVTGFTLWAELRTNEQVDTLVSQALARDALIGRIRVGALSLEAAIEDHIPATTDAERAAADARMVQILADISSASDEYTRDLPPKEAQTFKQFNETSQALAGQVRTAVRYSKRKEAERARKHLVEEIRPVTARLDGLAEELSRQNGEGTKELLRDLEDLRFRSTAAGATVAVLAILVSLGVGLRVTELVRRQEITIHDQLGELDRRNRELDSFASRVAHDLVAPLSPLKGYLTLIRRSPIPDPQTREMLAHAEASAGRMAELVEALLRFCRAGNRGEPTVSELDTAVSTILMEVSQTAALAGVKLERHLEDSVRVACQAQLLQSVAQNLLSNAVKYSAGRPEAKVTVRVVRHNGEAVLEVGDNGLGMSEQTQRSLFQPFFRAPEVRSLPGHGLGLATTKRLVEGHGGTLTVRSSLGNGTQVTVRYPEAPLQASTAAPASS